VGDGGGGRVMGVRRSRIPFQQQTEPRRPSPTAAANRQPPPPTANRCRTHVLPKELLVLDPKLRQAVGHGWREGGRGGGVYAAFLCLSYERERGRGKGEEDTACPGGVLLRLLLFAVCC
jgi:hypothetical protein